KVGIFLKQNRKVLQSKSFEISEERTVQQIDFDVLFKDTGLQVLEIEITQEEKDIAVSGFTAIQVLDNKAKIAILTDSFSWDTRAFSRIISANDRFDSELFYIEKGSLKQKGKNVKPIWGEYAGIAIFTDGSFLLNSNDLAAIKNLVLNGKGLFYFGNTANSLTDVLPSRPTNIKIQNEGQTHLTNEALAYQLFRDIEPHWSKLPPVEFYYLNPKEQATVLAEVRQQQQIPVILLDNYGTGNVLQIAFNGFWRWQFGLDSKSNENFVNNLAQWIFAGDSSNFYAYTDKNAYYLGERVTVKLVAFDEKLAPLSQLNAQIRLEDKEKTVFTEFLVKQSDIFAVNIPELPAGTYKYTIRDDVNQRETTGEFEILQQDIQSMHKGFNHKLLGEIAQASAGLKLTGKDLNSFSFPKVESQKKYKFHEIPLHKNALFIVVLLFSFTAELYLRKKWKLL
ncbi:MAG: hypothetical protein FWG20_06300, partial [Candidatus Cloacimonetes bacterium]|nr:hypothetical protein [Candidatus Cloacimonadota bacterium]